MRALIASSRHRLTCRRLRASIAAGRVVAVAELFGPVEEMLAEIRAALVRRRVGGLP